ncbi:MAG TPA: TonB family protein [Bryobacteraceae bacterium]|nr:TonB family protein [Bryobacteraceae bacterium]
MTQHADILDEQESLSRPLVGSVAVHVGILALAFLYTNFGGGSQVERWGDPNSLGGGAVGITPVQRIPLPSRQGRINPVANDTESQIPSAPVKPQPKQTVKEDPNAVALNSRNVKPKAPQTSPQKYSSEPQRNDRVYSSTGQAATSPMFSQAPGGGGVGSGSASPFGNRFGYYEQLIRDKVARNWRSQDLDSSVRNPVIVTFDILRGGVVQNVRVTRSSGNFAADQSAQRAIVMSNPFPPLPAQYERDSATIEFVFRLQ